MATEIERKFLVVGDDWRESVIRSARYRQGYLSSGENSSIRVRVSEEGAWLNIKGATVGVCRREYEYPIPLADAREILERLCEGNLVEKTRYYVAHEHRVWEVDVFEGENAGLVVAEIELTSEGEAFSRPDWVGDEVSDQVRYYNAYLAYHPYTTWAQGSRN